jgi:hypothetical protein
LDSDLDKATIAAVTMLSSIVMDDPTFLDEVVESRPSPTPYDLDDHMDTDSSEQLRQEVYGNPSWVRWGVIQKGEGVSTVGTYGYILLYM